MERATPKKAKANGSRLSGSTLSPSKVPLPASSTSSLPELLATLSSRLSETETSLNVLLNSPMTLEEQVESLPVLDRAKFYVTLTYAIDSLIFSFLRTNGANFKDHPVMRELERVKAYIHKVNVAEQVPTERNIVVNQPAAQRVILHSIPKNQITPDPNAISRHPVGQSATQKRVVHEISSDGSSSDEGQIRPAKKRKSEAMTISNHRDKKASTHETVALAAAQASISTLEKRQNPSFVMREADRGGSTGGLPNGSPKRAAPTAKKSKERRRKMKPEGTLNESGGSEKKRKTKREKEPSEPGGSRKKKGKIKSEEQPSESGGSKNRKRKGKKTMKMTKSE